MNDKMMLRCQNDCCRWIGSPDDLRLHQVTGLPMEECWLDACPECGARAFDGIHEPTLADELAAVEWRLRSINRKIVALQEQHPPLYMATTREMSDAGVSRVVVTDLPTVQEVQEICKHGHWAITKNIMEKIFVVYGSTGEYSDHTEWFVKAFSTEVKAKDFVVDVSRLAAAIREKYGVDNIPDRANTLDPKMEIDYTGVNYSYAEVPFEY